MKKEIILTLFLGAQKEFVVTDKYMKKQTIQNWGKPCIWLNNQDPMETPNMPNWQKEYMRANCIFVNLEHRLYIPAPVVPDMFIPWEQTPAPSTPQAQEEEITLDNADDLLLQGVVYLEDIDPSHNKLLTG
jgi:hypothetical protein